MRHLAIDYGTRRVGLAMSDESGQFVSPLDVLFVTSPAEAVDRVVQLVRREEPETIVIGLPINMDTSEGESAKSVRQWAATLQKSVSLPVVFVDERLTSFEAEQMLVQQQRSGRKLSRQDKKKRLDAIAAAVILQGYLDGSLPALDALPAE